MTDLKTDDEKAEEIKAWIKENGVSVFLGVAIAISGVFGWQQWGKHKEVKREEASALFSKTSDDLANVDLLKTQYTTSPYASLASLSAAKQFAAEGNNDKAIEELRWVSENASEENIKQIASLRLARMFLATEKLSDASVILSNEFAGSFTPIVEELKGDLHLASNETDKAIEAYRRAVEASGGAAPQYLSIKLNNLGG